MWKNSESVRGLDAPLGHCKHCLSVDHIVCAARTSCLLHSSPVSYYRIRLSGEPAGFPDRLLIGFNCCSVVAQWAVASAMLCTRHHRDMGCYKTCAFRKELSIKLDARGLKLCSNLCIRGLKHLLPYRWGHCINKSPDILSKWTYKTNYSHPGVIAQLSKTWISWFSGYKTFCKE